MKKRSRKEERTESGRMLQSPTDRLFERHFRGVLDESTATWRVIPEFISQGGTVLLRPCRSEMIDRGFFVAGKSTGGIKNEQKNTIGDIITLYHRLCAAAQYSCGARAKRNAYL